MNPQNNPLGKRNNVVVQELDGEVLIYDLTENKAFCLNETSALVWQACDGERNVSEISRFVSEKLNSPANEDLIWFALDQLKKEKLIANEEVVTDYFAGLSRREVIKKVGLGTMIALPMVASMVAPLAVQAQSCVAAICQCNTLMGNANGEVCATSPQQVEMGSLLGIDCDYSCSCFRTNQGNAGGTCGARVPA